MIDEDSVFDTNMVNNVITMEEDPDMPSQLSPEWHDYAMSKFVESELIEINGKKYPNCYGLRRVAMVLLGRIVLSGTKNVIHASAMSPPRTVIEYEIAIEKQDGSVISVSDVASVSSVNTDDLFLGYAEETAATRAEGRCLRKALMLNCVAAEELTRQKDVAKHVRQEINSAPTDGSYDGGGKITESQMRLLSNKCRELSIDELKFINTKQQWLSAPNQEPIILCGEKVYGQLSDVSKKNAINMIKLLNNYQNNSQTIPREIIKG